MAPSGLKIDTRRKQILELLERDGRVSVTRLSQELGATAVTIRSDLSALERDGYLERIQGGAIRKMRIQPQRPVGSNLPEKQAIAAVTARIIQNGDTLFLNSGTTTHQLAMALKEHRNLNVVTNSVAVAAELSAIATFHVILLGGELDPQYLYTSGGDAQEQLRKYQADYAILSLDGVSVENGITTYHADDLTFEDLPNPFLGSRDRKLYGLWPGSEALTIGVQRDPVAFDRTDNGAPVPAQVFRLPATETETLDYNVYMGGDVGETVLRTDRPELPNALIFGDSFTNALETMLYASFNETRSVDLRHYTDMTIRAYIASCCCGQSAHLLLDRRWDFPHGPAETPIRPACWSNRSATKK